MSMTTNERITLLRKRQGIDQKDLAVIIGIGIATFSQKVNGLADWRLSELEKIADALGCTVKDLIGDCDNETTMQ